MFGRAFNHHGCVGLLVSLQKLLRGEIVTTFSADVVDACEFFMFVDLQGLAQPGSVDDVAVDALNGYWNMFAVFVVLIFVVFVSIIGLFFLLRLCS